jgi:mRNA degradation ribonuclease J1/J2
MCQTPRRRDDHGCDADHYRRGVCVKACIHRGAHEIGRSLVELECNGERLVLDAGLPLNVEGVPQRDLLPDVPGLWAEGDGSLRALVISHPHPDHHGLADLVDPSVPILFPMRNYANHGERRSTDSPAKDHYPNLG